MSTTIGTKDIPSDEITVSAGETVSVGVAFDATVGIVGGMDTSNGSATAGTATEVSNPTDAKNKFGDGSELHDAAKLVFRHSLDTVYMVGVTETDETENFSSTSSGTLANTPAMDPNLHGDETLTAQDDGNNTITVNIVYDDPPSTPSSSDTINLNPHTGDWEADASDTYDITYTHGDYSSAITDIADEAPRVVGVLSETESHASDLATELGESSGIAANFEFAHGFVGAPPRQDAATASNYASNYTDSVDDKRVSIVAPPRGYTDVDETEEERTVAEIAARAAALPLGETMTRDEDALGGFESLRTALGTSDASTFIDSQVMPLFDNVPEVVKDQVTSTTVRFERVYSNQIVDEATARVHNVSTDYVGGLNIDADRRQYRRNLRNELNDMANNAPPLLYGDPPFAVNISVPSSDPNQVDVEVGLDVVDVVDVVDVEIAVGDVIQNLN